MSTIVSFRVILILVLLGVSCPNPLQGMSGSVPSSFIILLSVVIL